MHNAHRIEMRKTPRLLRRKRSTHFALNAMREADSGLFDFEQLTFPSIHPILDRERGQTNTRLVGLLAPVLDAGLSALSFTFSQPGAPRWGAGHRTGADWTAFTLMSDWS